MAPPPTTLFNVSDASHVGAVRRSVARILGAIHADETAIGNASIVASELTTNLHKHATSGQLLLSLVSEPNGYSLEFLALDKGPGIADVARALEDGFSTAGTAGNGLGAVRRLSHEFDIYSLRGKITAVYAKFSLHRTARDPKASRFEWGAVNVPVHTETVSGDAWCVEELEQGLRFLVADGLGHGPGAAEASQAALDVFLAAREQGAGRVLESAHVRLNGTRGAAVANGRILPPGLTFAGVGNISATVVEDTQQRGLMSHHGIVGTRQIKVTELTSDWSPRAVLVLHSDGLGTRWRLSDWPGLASRHPAIIAGVLYAVHARGRDDVTVLVMRQRSQEDGK